MVPAGWWLPQHRDTAPRVTAGGGRGAEHGVRGVSTDPGCCPDGWQGPKCAPLLARQHPGYAPTNLPCLLGSAPPVFSQPFSLIPIEASRVSVSLKSERNLMMKLNIIQFPYERCKLDPVLPGKRLAPEPCSEPQGSPTAERVTGQSSAQGCAWEGAELFSLGVFAFPRGSSPPRPCPLHSFSNTYSNPRLHGC